jgi:hypothetical protein
MEEREGGGVKPTGFMVGNFTAPLLELYCCPSALQLWQREAVGSTHSPGRSVKRGGIDERNRRETVWESCVSAVEGAGEEVE